MNWRALASHVAGNRLRSEDLGDSKLGRSRDHATRAPFRTRLDAALSSRRIRHYGFLANARRAAKVALCRNLLDMPSPSAQQVDVVVPPRAPERCPCCGGAMMVLDILPRPAPVPRPFQDDTS
jgi:hypothetical protein